MAGSAKAARAAKPIAIRLMGRRFIRSTTCSKRILVEHPCAITPSKATVSCRRNATLSGSGVWLTARGCSLWSNLPHCSVIVFSAPYAHAVKGATLVEGNAALQFGSVALLVAEPVENGLRPHPAGLCQFKHGSIAGIAATRGRPIQATGRTQLESRHWVKA